MIRFVKTGRNESAKKQDKEEKEEKEEDPGKDILLNSRFILWMWKVFVCFYFIFCFVEVKKRKKIGKTQNINQMIKN